MKLHFGNMNLNFTTEQTIGYMDSKPQSTVVLSCSFREMVCGKITYLLIPFMCFREYICVIKMPVLTNTVL